MISGLFMNIVRLINQYLNGRGKSKGRQPCERFSSFDYCYNHFYSFYHDNRVSELADDRNLQMSCLQLGFYLASWGMLRGSSFLIEKSVKHYGNVISAISEMDPILWEIDVDSYSEENIDLLMDCKTRIIDALGRDNAKTLDTLVSKIMLGVFANVPAFDANFCGSMHMHKLNQDSLREIKKFYNDHEESFDSVNTIYTYDFSGGETDIIYTKAKLVDMCGFMDGQ